MLVWYFILSLLFEFKLNLGLETNFDQFCHKWDRYIALVLFSSGNFTATVTRSRIFLNPSQMLSDSSKNSRRIVIRTACSSANHSNQVSFSFSPLRIKPLIKWTSAVTWNQCQIEKLSNTINPEKVVPLSFSNFRLFDETIYWVLRYFVKYQG